MKGDGTELTLEKERLSEKTCLVSTPDSVSALTPEKIDECGNNQANQQVTLSPVTVNKSPAQERHTGSDIKVTLENEAVWSRFHSLGTEMILTKQGRRMFPSCRFRLSGLDPQRKYFLVMDIVSLDDFTHKWNGKTWETVTVDVPHVPHVLGQICVHPDSPAPGQQWMDSPVSFYKVKLTSDFIDQEGCVILRPMYRYQPRLHIVPVDLDSERTIAVDGPNVKKFSFPQTEFYAVTCYQNAQITQLKIDCNPFAMAFREDSQSINLLQNKLRLCSSIGTHFQSPLLSFAQNLNGKQKEGAVNSTASTSIQDNRVLCPGSASSKEATLSCPSDLDLCQTNTDYSESDGGNKAVVNKCLLEPVHEHVAPLAFEPNVTVSLEEPLQGTDETAPPISNSENLKSSEDAVNSQINCTNYESPSKSSVAAQSQGKIRSNVVPLLRPLYLSGSQVQARKPARLLRHRYFHRGRKAKSKWWSNIKYARSRPSVVPHNVSLQPDLEDVDGMLFASFVAKEALNIPVENIKESETSLHTPSLTHDQSDYHKSEDVSVSVEERIARLEKSLLLHLKQLKHRQVIHPRLQDVGMKLSLLDPKLPINLQYLGVHLPLSSPVHEGLDKMNPTSLSSSPDAAECFVSRTGKTNDPTKIKGWRDKFKTSAGPSVSEGLKNSSAFCSEMLDAYLENEAQQISDRAEVFSKCSASPVSYQLPSKSSSYVVTLDSLLRTRSTSSNKVCRKSADNIVPKSPLTRSPSTAVPLSLQAFQCRFERNQKKGKKSAHSFQAHRNAVSTVQTSRSMSFVSKPGLNTQPGNSQLKWKNSAKTASNSSVCTTIIPVKLKNQKMLQEMEEEAIFHGKDRTHITTKRAKIALTSLLNFQKLTIRPKLHMHHKDENTCPADFCRLGCMCDSLDREIRGPTHCRRVECMFDCNCFKHKVLLRHPSKANVQRGRNRSVLAFSIADQENQSRPPPAPSITTLWKRTTEEKDPEPLFIPVPPISTLHSTSQVWEEDKDPVYLYFESRMTCARVREYNSNPPPQIHMFPTKTERKTLKEFNETAEASELPSSQKTPEPNPTKVKPCEPKPTKLLEILSECNWEPHRSLVLSTLFRYTNSDLLSEPFCLGMYKVQPLSTTIKGGDRSSTITYKVCISRAEEKEMTKDLQQPVKKAIRNHGLNRFKTSGLQTHEAESQKAEAATDSSPKSNTLEEKQLYKPLFRSLPFTPTAAGYLKANKKNPGGPSQGLIKVNGKTYNKAKLLLGQLGTLHPVNHFAAFVSGRLQPVLQNKAKIEGDATKACLPKAPLKPSSVTEEAKVSNQTPSNLAVARLPSASAAEPDTAFKNTKSNRSPLDALKNFVGPPPGRTPSVPDGSRFVLVPVMPSNSTASPSADTVTSFTLPPGQQVVLQPASGMPGSNYVCQYNGQMIQLKPMNPLVQPQPSSVSEGSVSLVKTAYNTCVPKDTRSQQTPLNSAPLTKTLPEPISVIAPKVLSLSAKSGITIANGMPAFNLQSSFPGRTGTFSFRICPPTGEGRSVGSEHSGKPPEPLVGQSSALLLPGGFTLIKLFNPAVASVPAVPINVNSATSYPVEIPQTNESMKKSSLQSCSPSLEQNCQVSKSITNPPLPETSDCGSTADLNQSSDDFPSEGVIKDEPVQPSELIGKCDWVPEGAEMVHTNDIIKLESKDFDDWPPEGAERILWIESGGEEENEDINKEPYKNLDAAVERPTAEEARVSKTPTRETVQADFSGCDECLHAYKLHANKKETPTPSSIHENRLQLEEDACFKSSHSDKQKQHLKSNIINSGQEKACNPYVDAANSNTANISQQEPPLSALNNSPKIREQVVNQENGFPVLITNEPFNKSIETDVGGNEPDLKNQGRIPENSTLRICEIESYNNQTWENTQPNNFHVGEQRLGFTNNYGVSIKTESCSDSPQADTCSVPNDVVKQHIGSENISPLMKKEKPSMNQTVTKFCDPSKQCLGSKNNSQILNHGDFYNSPTKSNLSGNCAKISQINKQDLKAGKDETKDRNKQLVTKTAVGRLCEDENIRVDVINLSEDEGPSDDFDRDDGEGDLNSDKEDSSDETSSDSDTTNDTADMSNEDDVDLESFEENDAEGIINKTKCKKTEMRAATLRKKIKHSSSISSTAGCLRMHELEKRQSHTEKERVRRGEMCRSFAALKKALNIEERLTMCRHDILNQARSMIWALEDRSNCLEEKKQALFQRQTAYLSKIVELSERTEAGDEASFEYQKRFGSQNSLQTSGPLVNPRRLDSEGNRLPPRLGRWKAPNYIRKRSKKALRQPSVTATVAADEGLKAHLSPDTPDHHTVNGPLSSVSTEDLVWTLIAQNPNGLPPVHKTSQKESSSPESKPTEKRSLPKIVLQSFGKTDTLKLTHDIKTSLPSSTEVSNSNKLLNDGNFDLQGQSEGMEKYTSTKVCDDVEKTVVSEHSDKESSAPSSALTKSDVQNNTLSKLEKNKQASAAVEKGRKKRGKSEVVIKEALSNPELLGPRQLRQRSPAVNGGGRKGWLNN